MAKLETAVDMQIDFPPDMALSRFRDALKGSMRISKEALKLLLAEDKVTPLVPQKRGPKPKSVHASK